MKSISNLILGSILMTVVIVFGVWGYLEIENTAKQEAKRVEKNQNRIVERLAFNLAYPVWNFNLSETEKNIQNEALDENILSIQVFDENNDLYAGLIRDNINGKITKLNSNSILAEKASLSKSVSYTHQISYKGKAIGKVVVYNNGKPLQLLIRHLRNIRLIELLILVITLAVVQYFILRKVIIKPLSLLKEWSSSIGLNAIVPYPKFYQSAEIHSLFSSFSEMTNRLFSSINEISIKNDELTESKNKLNITNKELQEAKERAEESDLLKSAFLANMSHEIRTPMNGILGFTELLKDDNLSPEEQKSYIEIIEKSGIRLLNIINDIIDISKIEAGQMNVVFSATTLNDLTQFLFNFFKREAQEKGIQLTLKNTLSDEEATIITDREKLFAILTNLIKNAIKFTDKGSVEFGYNKKDDYLEFFVKDSGIGIPKNKQKAVFERFIQADITGKMARQGTGLGLSISKAYIEMLGGEIWVESEPEKGSTFYFTLPYNNEQAINKIGEKDLTSNTENTTDKNLKILIAEDDEISRKLISKVIQPFAYEILFAKSGVETVEIAKNTPDIDLILMDMQMPLMNGCEATEKIREFNKTIVIIAQTAFALEGDKERMITCGCTDYISKPIKKEEIRIKIKQYFENNIKNTTFE